MVDLRLPEGSGDAHIAAARGVLLHVASAFPLAGLAITGSVSRCTHTPDSDLDLIVADRSFRRDMQFAMRVHGVRTAVVCLQTRFTAERERRWMLAGGSDAKLVSMVRSARVVHDPSLAFRDLQRTVHRLDSCRLARRAELLAACRDDAGALVQGLREPGRTPRVVDMVQLLARIIDGWRLREGLMDDSKERSRHTFAEIAERDPLLFERLRAAVPVTSESLPPLLQAFAVVFDPSSDSLLRPGRTGPQGGA